ncbi:MULTISPECIES: Gfo/Idh/MocA family protein [Haloferax]|uniref:Gfo/Idh/MocA family oxidoreductase n=1 Tax=Haloferax marinum TaxID=2666143 RepID=A0A6A8G9N7_9EURY|nr:MULTISPECIES: Gfo/Idh/MocA family oxidoreductase [Haloferax]KAB1198205.1 Gfo/Idh/MocA family oxidoreductase [Haloferax sp. CBA1150]MRW97292.1 gfo/Idh/MocA family oxidoreductase [Haloferax marinum]
MSNNDTPLNVGVIGVGSMGRHHARVYSELPSATLVGVSDVDTEQAREVAQKHGTEALPMDDLLDRVDAVSVVVPTQYHLDTAKQCLSAGVAPLIEKPVVENQRQGEELLSLRDTVGLPVQVGHIERFNPAIQALTDVLSGLNVLSIKTERLGPPPRREIDDSAVLDLMIHDLDIVLSLDDSDVEEVHSAGVRENRHATATLQFESGTIANLTASRLTQRKVRRLVVTAEECLVEVDYMDQSIEIHRRSVPEYIENGGDIKYRHESIIERPTVNHGEPLKNELESFIGAVANGSEPVVTVEDGLNALELAQTIDENDAPEHKKTINPIQ